MNLCNQEIPTLEIVKVLENRKNRNIIIVGKDNEGTLSIYKGSSGKEQEEQAEEDKKKYGWWNKTPELCRQRIAMEKHFLEYFKHENIRDLEPCKYLSQNPQSSFFRLNFNPQEIILRDLIKANKKLSEGKKPKISERSVFYNPVAIIRHQQKFNNNYLSRLDYVLAIGIDLISALGYLHDKGFVHRDVKPSNILVGGNTTSVKARLHDFDIAGLDLRHPPKDEKWKQELCTDLTKFIEHFSYASIGTPPYAHLSQYSQNSHRGCDLHGLGQTIYELIGADLTKGEYPSIEDMLPIKEEESKPEREARRGLASMLKEALDDCINPLGNKLDEDYDSIINRFYELEGEVRRLKNKV